MKIKFLKKFKKQTQDFSIDFLIIGAQRCGTTSLYNYMIEHPQINSAKEKELHFFDNNFQKGLKWYLKQFSFSSEANERFLTGEATPYYIFHPLAPKRIFELFPTVKLIVLLRNPVERAFSHYNHEVRNGNESLSFEESLKEEDKRLSGEKEKILSGKYSFEYQNHSYLSRGIYVNQLKTYFNIFPKENFLILNSEDFYSTPQLTLNNVFNFLKIDNFELNKFNKFNSGKNEEMKESTRKFLEDYFKPHNFELYKLLNRSFNW